MIPDMKPDFKNINIKDATPCKDQCTYRDESNVEKIWKTPEHIEVKPVYTREDLEGMEHLNYAAGITPYLRGPYSTMNVKRPGLSVSKPDSLQPRSPTHSTAAIWPPVRKVCR